MILIVIAEGKQSIPISSRVTGNHSTFTGPISIASNSDSNLVFNQLESRIMHLRFLSNSNNLNTQINKLHNLKYWDYAPGLACSSVYRVSKLGFFRIEVRNFS